MSVFDVSTKKKKSRRHVHPDLDRARMLIDACRALPEVNTNTAVLRRAIESDAEAERLHDRYHRMALQARQEAEHAWSWLQSAYTTKERAAALKEAKRLAKERHK